MAYNLFHNSAVRVCVYMSPLYGKPQPGRLVPQTLALGITEPHGMRTLRDNALGNHTATRGSTAPGQKLGRYGLHPGRSRSTGGPRHHSVHTHLVTLGTLG